MLVKRTVSYYNRIALVMEPVASVKRGDVFYITCIDEPEKRKSLYVKYKSGYHCVFRQKEYSYATYRNTETGNREADFTQI